MQFNIARTRMLANMVGFLPDPEATPERLELLHLLSEELADLKAEYFTMLYGGPLRVAVRVSGAAAAHTPWQPLPRHLPHSLLPIWGRRVSFCLPTNCQ